MRSAAGACTVILLVITGCQNESGYRGGDLRSVPSVASFVAGLGSAPSVIVVFNPNDCLSCATSIGSWLALRRATSGRVHFLVNVLPDSATLLVLRRARVPIDGVLGRSASRTPSPPAAYVHLAESSPLLEFRLSRDTPSAVRPFIQPSQGEN